MARMRLDINRDGRGEYSFGRFGSTGLESVALAAIYGLFREKREIPPLWREGELGTGEIWGALGGILGAVWWRGALPRGSCYEFSRPIPGG